MDRARAKDRLLYVAYVTVSLLLIGVLFLM